MLFIGFIIAFYTDVFLDLNLVGKIVFSPFLLVLCACVLPFVALEIVLIDPCVLLLAAFSRSGTVGEAVRYLLAID